jgi:hypothetical protein
MKSLVSPELSFLKICFRPYSAERITKVHRLIAGFFSGAMASNRKRFSNYGCQHMRYKKQFFPGIFPIDLIYN